MLESQVEHKHGSGNIVDRYGRSQSWPRFLVQLCRHSGGQLAGLHASSVDGNLWTDRAENDYLFVSPARSRNERR